MNRMMNLLLVSLLAFFLAACTADSQSSQNVDLSLEPEPEPDTLITFRMAFVGDLMCHDPQFERAMDGETGMYDFRPCYEPVKDILSAPDLTIGNLETTLPGPGVCCTGYPTFGSPDEYAAALKDAGFDFLTTANNHSMDKGWNGVSRTIQVLDSLEIGHTGTYASQEDRDSIRILEVGGVKIAMLDYTYGTNYIPLPEGKPWAVNMIDDHEVKADVPAARAAGADLVMVLYHFGKEYVHHPNKYQKTAVAEAQEAGADLIIGGHPHVLQPVEFFKTDSSANLKEGVVAWSLGNFISNQSAAPRRSGTILEIEVTRHLGTDSLWVSAVEFTPTWVYRGAHPDRQVHTILPAKLGLDSVPAYSWLVKDDLALMKEAYDSASFYLTEYDDRVKLKK